MSDLFSVGNIDKKQFVKVNDFVPAGFEAAADKLIGVSSQRIATVVIYLTSTCDSFPAMGAWAKDQVIVARDGDLRTTIYEEMCETWEDVTEEVVAGFLETVQGSSEPFVLPVVRCPSCARSTAHVHYGGSSSVMAIRCSMCGDWATMQEAGAKWSAEDVL